MRRIMHRGRKASTHLAFNHALLQVRDVEQSVGFYRGQLGFSLIDKQELDGVLVYARMRLPVGASTLGLRRCDREPDFAFSDGIRLHFESRDIDRLCRRLAAQGVSFEQMPKRMPWGWKHAYLKDPDGHEVCLYSAGAARLRKSSGV